VEDSRTLLEVTPVVSVDRIFRSSLSFSSGAKRWVLPFGLRLGGGIVTSSDQIVFRGKPFPVDLPILYSVSWT